MAKPVTWNPKYAMDPAHRGRVLIFSNSVSYPPFNQRLPHREFTDEDASRLMKAFLTRGFRNVRVYKEKAAHEMLREIKIASKESHKDRDCIVVAFLSYGEHNVIHARDNPVALQELLAPLKGDCCDPDLVGKPKIIILQNDNPNQDEFENDEDTQYVPNAVGDAMEEKKKVRHEIPTEADFVYLGSEMPGLLTNRSMKDGSIFISHLAKNILEHGETMELRRLATQTLADVEGEMDKWQADWAEQNDECMPYFISLLTKDLVLGGGAKK